MKTNILLIFAIVAIVVAFINLSVSFTRLVNLRNVLTGMIGTEGYVNLTILALAELNFTDDFINWSVGSIQPPSTVAYLWSNGTIAGGNWTAESTGFAIDNIGSVNLSLTLAASKSAADFISGSSPEYKWNLSNTEAGSCVASGGINLGVYANTNTSAKFCSNFSWQAAGDSVRLDIGVKIDQAASAGAKTDTITATGTVSA